MLYRILQDKGYLFRFRIYDIKRLECKSAWQLDLQKKSGSQPELKSAVASMDDVDELFDELSDGGEAKYFERDKNYAYSDDPRGNFEDFVL